MQFRFALFTMGMMKLAIKGLRDPDLVHPPAALAAIEARTRAMGFDLASETRTGALLRALAASKPGGRLLELGTGTGVATAWILSGMDAHATLTSVDISSAHQHVAREFLGHDTRLTLVLEDGHQFLKRQPEASYDFVFADAMPGKYEGMEDCLRIVKHGGFYIVDDLIPQVKWPEGHAEKVPVLIEHLAGDGRFAIAPLYWATGVIVAVRR